MGGRPQLVDTPNPAPPQEDVPNATPTPYSLATNEASVNPSQKLASGLIHSHQYPIKKGELPIFKEEEVEGQIRSIECYFRINKVEDLKHLELMLTYMEGLGLHWFIWIENRYSLKDWDNFKLQIGTHFSHSLFDNILHQFLNILQTRSMGEYRQEFEHLSMYLPPLQYVIMEQTFIKSLMPKIQLKISQDNLIRLRAIMDASLQAEKRLKSLWDAWNSSCGRGATTYMEQTQPYNSQQRYLYLQKSSPRDFNRPNQAIWAHNRKSETTS